MTQKQPGGVSRRAFLKGGIVGGSLLVAGWGVSPWIGKVFHRTGMFVYPDRPPTWQGVQTLYSVCEQCSSDCGMEAHVYRGVLQKLDGNPYHPNGTEPHANYDTPTQAARVWSAPHSLCPRGQAGRQTLYDPYRVTLPLKRTGPRGSGKWQTISWEQLLAEVTEGGYLFKHVPGEENRLVPGFAPVYDGGSGQTAPIDPRHPDLGPKTNGLVLYMGASEAGQNDLLARFASSFGTVNVEAADSCCDLNRMQSNMLSLDGMTDPLKPDVENAEYVLWFGVNVLEAHFPMQTLARKVADASAQGTLKYHIVDVRGGNSLLHADRYVFVKPGGDGALAMAMIRWIIENDAYDRRYLSAPSQDAAARIGEPTYSNASWLVVADQKHPGYGQFLQPASSAGGMAGAGASMGGAGTVLDPATKMPVSSQTAAEGLVWPSGTPDTRTVDVGGVACRTALQMLYLEAARYSYAEYAEAAGVSLETIQLLAREFTSHGKHAAADFGRGPTMHSNGLYAGRAIMTLNFLIGNVDWVGGMTVGGGGADYMGAGQGQPYNLGSWPKQVSSVPSGVPVSRSGVAYESTSLYQDAMKAGKPYPAPRPWFQFGGGQWPEMYAGIYMGYPYPIQILVQHMANPAWSMPAMGGADDSGLSWAKVTDDTAKVPLFIAIDTLVSESSSHADYIIPDTTYLERWDFPSVWPFVPTLAQGIRRPVVEPLTGRTPAGAPMCMEQFLIDVAKRLGLPGFGAGAFMEGGSLETREDIFLKMAANVAYDSASFLGWQGGRSVTLGAVPDAAGEELETVRELRAGHADALTDAQWRKVAYVLARGGRFEEYWAGYLPSSDMVGRLGTNGRRLVVSTGVDGWVLNRGQTTPGEMRQAVLRGIDQGRGGQSPLWMAHRYGVGGVACQIWNQSVATARNAVTGQAFCGSGRYEPPHDMRGDLFSTLDDPKEFPFVLTTHKSTVGSRSYSASDPWLLEMVPEAFIDMNPDDAARLGLQSGDLVRVSSATHREGIKGHVRLLPGVRPGVVNFPHSYGHWRYGSDTIVVDGVAVTGNPARNAPVRLNAVMRLDESLTGGLPTGVADQVAGGQAYMETRVRIERA